MREEDDLVELEKLIKVTQLVANAIVPSNVLDIRAASRRLGAHLIIGPSPARVSPARLLCCLLAAG